MQTLYAVYIVLALLGTLFDVGGTRMSNNYKPFQVFFPIYKFAGSVAFSLV